ncbi:hypothetical protein [Oenococcus sicerae]|uniref:hypothetical protein n=1 Tax=Oenococcus sicerae TaxID=2203724 RepID=UPI0039E7CC1B
MEAWFSDILVFLAAVIAAYVTAKITASLKNEPAFADKVIQQTDTITTLTTDVSNLKQKYKESEEHRKQDQELIKTLLAQNKILKKQNKLLLDFAKNNGFPVDDILAGKAS